MSPQPDSILNITIDPRWSHGVFHYGDDDPMTFPFIGWAVVVDAKSTDTGAYDTSLTPVFLDEPSALTLDDLIASYGSEPRLTYSRLVPAGNLS